MDNADRGTLERAIKNIFTMQVNSLALKISLYTYVIVIERHYEYIKRRFQNEKKNI